MSYCDDHVDEVEKSVEKQKALHVVQQKIIEQLFTCPSEKKFLQGPIKYKIVQFIEVHGRK